MSERRSTLRRVVTPGAEKNPALAFLQRAGVSVAPLVASSSRLTTQGAALLTLGASPYAALYERQSLGAVSDRGILGPPGRLEFREGTEQAVSVLNLASHSYLGLSADPRVKQAAIAAIERYGTHIGGARLLSGTAAIHVELDERLARLTGTAGVVTYSSAYGANLSVVSSLFGAGDLIILDRDAHRSLYDGAALSRADMRRFAHNDLEHLETILRRTGSVRRRLIVVDAVYSMEGHIAPLPELICLARRHGAFLLADEAHAFGVLGERGRGAVEHFGLDPGAIDLRIGALSKAIPAVGGFALADSGIAGLLRYISPTRVFSAPMTPPDAAAAATALDILEREPERVARLQHNAALFRSALERQGVDTMGSETPIVPVWLGDRTATLTAASALLTRGIFVNAIISPGVPEGTERLRCLVTAMHVESDLAHAAEVIGEVVRPLCRPCPGRLRRAGRRSVSQD